MTDYTKQLVEQRRELHQWPEEGWTEFWTTNYIVTKLRSWGYEVLLGTKIINPEQVFGRNEKLVQEGIKNALARGVSQSFIDETEGYTGCVALLDTGKEGPTTAFRFDIDCVCVNETDNPEHKPNKEGFRSQHAGFMHACGHDSHISIGLTLAHWIAEHKDELKGKSRSSSSPLKKVFAAPALLLLPELLTMPTTSSAATFPSWLIPVKSLPLLTACFAPPNTT